MEPKKEFSDIPAPADESCRGELLRMLGDATEIIDESYTELQQREPNVVDPMNDKLIYLREMSEVVGQRLLIDGLKKALQSS